MCSRSHRLTEEIRESITAPETTSKVPKDTECGSPGLARDTAASAVVDSRKKTADVVEKGDRLKSPMGASTAVTARRETKLQQCQQQHLTKAAQLLKRVAEKQLTGTSAAERIMAKKLTALPDVEPPSAHAQPAARDTARELPWPKVFRDDTVVMTAPSIATYDNRTVTMSDNVAAERRSDLAANIHVDKPTTERQTAVALKGPRVQFQQADVTSQDDSDLRTVSVKNTNSFLPFKESVLVLSVKHCIYVESSSSSSSTVCVQSTYSWADPVIVYNVKEGSLDCNVKGTVAVNFGVSSHSVSKPLS